MDGFGVFARRTIRLLWGHDQSEDVLAGVMLFIAATRNLSFLEVSAAAVTLLFQVVVSLGLARVVLNFPLNGT